MTREWAAGCAGEQKAVARRVQQRCYRAMLEEEESWPVREGGTGASVVREVGTGASAGRSAVASGGSMQQQQQQWEDGHPLAHPLLDKLADHLLDLLPRLPRWLPLPPAPPNTPASMQMSSPHALRDNARGH